MPAAAERPRIASVIAGRHAGPPAGERPKRAPAKAARSPRERTCTIRGERSALPLEGFAEVWNEGNVQPRIRSSRMSTTAPPFATVDAYLESHLERSLAE